MQSNHRRNARATESSLTGDLGGEQWPCDGDDSGRLTVHSRDGVGSSNSMLAMERLLSLGVNNSSMLTSARMSSGSGRSSGQTSSSRSTKSSPSKSGSTMRTRIDTEL